MIIYIVEIRYFKKKKTLWQFNGMHFCANVFSFRLSCQMNSKLKIEALTLTNKEAHKGKLELTQNFLPVFKKKRFVLLLKLLYFVGNKVSNGVVRTLRV